MTCSQLKRDHKNLVLDASVILNILGTGKPDEILKALDREVMVEEITFREIKRDPFSKQPAEQILMELTNTDLLRQVQLSNAGYNEFLDIVGTPPPNSLDDGEAAALAYANETENAVVVIDERKGIKIAKSRYPSMTVCSSLDLLSSAILQEYFSKENFRDILYNALTKARMRVPSEYKTWIVETLGDERSQDCPSLSHFSATILNK